MKAFIDTNVLVYASTGEDPHKQQLARALLARHPARTLSISTQVLGEAYNVLTTTKRWDKSEALTAVRLFTRMRVLVPGVDTVLRALELAALHTLSTWDALIVQAALEGDCDTLFTEDMQAGRKFGVLEIVNPFELKAHEAQPALKAPRPKARRAGRARP